MSQMYLGFKLVQSLLQEPLSQDGKLPCNRKMTDSWERGKPSEPFKGLGFGDSDSPK